MAFAITQSCCSDASCVSVCPVNCIHPTPDEPDFATAEMLYIDPRSCIDCGACADACPVDAIFPTDLLLGPTKLYADLNRDHFTDRDVVTAWSEPHFPASLEGHASGLRVAIVGTGPAAAYTASALLTTSTEVTMVDRLAVPGGLVRWGVAPDHQSTKAIGDRFATVFRHPRLTMHLGVEVGTDLTHDDLLAHHDAVVYAVGATSDRRLGVTGEDLPGSLSARTFVGWYNDHPEIPADLVDLAAAPVGRVVVIGNGNVALDMARILLTDPERLAGTGIAAHALAQLRRSTVREVVLVARRGPGDAAYSLSELRALLGDDDIDVVVNGTPGVRAAIEDPAAGDRAAALRGLPCDPVDWTVAPTSRRRLVLRFGSTTEEVVGTDRVEAVRLAPTSGSGAVTRVPTGLLLRSVGYRSEPLAGLPFDHETHTVPHQAGRVVDPETGSIVPRTYVVGWVKRGPSGGIGSNRVDAAETATSVISDANARRLGGGTRSNRGFDRLLRRLPRRLTGVS